MKSVISRLFSKMRGIGIEMKRCLQFARGVYPFKGYCSKILLGAFLVLGVTSTSFAADHNKRGKNTANYTKRQKGKVLYWGTFNWNERYWGSTSDDYATHNKREKNTPAHNKR